VPPQVPLRVCLDRLRPCLEDEALPKAGQNLKYEWIVFRRAGIRLAGIRSDSMIASYLLDPSRMQHNLDELAREHLDHRTITYADVTGIGRKQIPFGDVPIDRATTYACEDADVALRLVQKLEPQLEADGSRPLPPIEIPLSRCSPAWMNGVRIDVDLCGPLGEVQEELREIEARRTPAGEGFNLNSRASSPGALRAARLPVMKRTPKGGLDGHRCPGAAGRPARSAPGDRPAPAARQAQGDLRRHAARADPPRDRPDPHLLQPDGHGDRKALLERSEPPEHPHPHGRGARDPARLRPGAGPPADLGGLFPGRAPHPGPPVRGISPHRRLER
jgi:hypothetical protein